MSIELRLSLILILIGCHAAPDATAVLAEYRDRIDARLRLIESLRAQAAQMPRLTEDRLDALDPPPDFRRRAAAGKAVFVEIDHLLQTDRRSLGQDFIVSYDVTVTTVATIVRDGHYPPPNDHLKLANADGEILRQDLERFLQLRYLFLIRTVEMEKPFLLGDQDQELATRRFKPGHYRGEVLGFDLEHAKPVGGYSIRVETDPQVKVSTVTYVSDLMRSLGRKARERIAQRAKELLPAASIDPAMKPN
ncbi:MAG: hypothetical protein ACYTEZ_19310 [Planctomycetota bacterium]|jgi:hypothetical protein